MTYPENSSAVSSQWWRWPLVPIASVLGGMLGALLFSLLQWFSLKLQGGFSEDGWFFLYVIPAMSAAAFGYLYIMIAAYVAPRAKFITSVVMVTLLMVLIVMLLVWAWSSYANLPLGQSIKSTIELILSGIAAIVSVINTKDQYGDI